MAGWRVLTLSSKQGIPDRPVILVKHDFRAAQYTVYVTDLAHVWQESLDRKSIIKRALQEDTSIDPSEGTDQLRLLLQHIEDAIDGVTGSRKLLPAGDTDSLTLQLTVDLPVPLQPLLWSIQLERKPSNVLFEQLQVPLFERAFSQRQQTQWLLSRINEKDNVISRLTDKLENAGIDIGTVFPAAGSIRGSKSQVRESLLKKVPGLKPFDESAWLHEQIVSGRPEKEAVLTSALGDHGPVPTTNWSFPGAWWESLPTTGNDLVSSFRDDRKPSPPPLKRQEISRTSEDDFQTQDISKFSRNRPDASRILVKDSQLPHATRTADVSDSDATTEDEEDGLDDSTSNAGHGDKPPALEQPMQSPARRLGVLGRNQAKPLESPSTVPESMEIDSVRNSFHNVPEPDTSSTAPRRKLGTIGGKPSSTLDVPVKSPQEGDTEMTQENDEARPSRSPLRRSETPPRETSTERADRKREELKRDLEERKKAPPKKKRKF